MLKSNRLNFSELYVVAVWENEGGGLHATVCEHGPTRTFLQERLKAEKQGHGNEGAKPDFQKGHARAPERKATQRNRTHPTATPLPPAQRLSLTA